MQFKKGKLVNTLLVGFATLGLAFGVTSCNFEPAQVDWDLPSDDPDTEKTITFWHCLGQGNEETLQELVDEFNEEYKGKYNVVLEKRAGTYDNLHSIIKTNLSGDIVPALAMGYPDSFAEYISSDIDDSYLIRLTNFIEDNEFGYTDAELEDFVDEYLKEGQNYHYEGTWSMPMYKSTEAMFYNKNYLAGENAETQAVLGTDSTYNAYVEALVAEGNTPSDETLNTLKTYVDSKGGYTYDVPTTWDEMVSVAREIVSNRNAEGITETLIPVGYDSDSNLLITQFEQRGIPYTQLIDEGDDYRNHYLFNNDAAKDFVTEVTTMISEGLFTTKNALSGTYTSEPFVEGELVFAIGSTGGSDYNVSSNFGVGITAVPYYTDENDNGEPKYIMQGPSICFFNNDDEYIHKGAWLFYKFIAEPENNAYLALNNSYDPIRESSYSLDMYSSWVANAGRGDLKYDIPNVTQYLRDYYMTSPVFVGSSKARDQIGEIITYVVLNKDSVEDAFSRALQECYQSVY